MTQNQNVDVTAGRKIICDSEMTWMPSAAGEKVLHPDEGRSDESVGGGPGAACEGDRVGHVVVSWCWLT